MCSIIFYIHCSSKTGRRDMKTALSPNQFTKKTWKHLGLKRFKRVYLFSKVHCYIGFKRFMYEGNMQKTKPKHAKRIHVFLIESGLRSVTHDEWFFYRLVKEFPCQQSWNLYQHTWVITTTDSSRFFNFCNCCLNCRLYLSNMQTLSDFLEAEDGVAKEEIARNLSFCHNVLTLFNT